MVARDVFRFSHFSLLKCSKALQRLSAAQQDGDSQSKAPFTILRGWCLTHIELGSQSCPTDTPRKPPTTSQARSSSSAAKSRSTVAIAKRCSLLVNLTRPSRLERSPSICVSAQCSACPTYRIERSKCLVQKN